MKMFIIAAVLLVTGYVLGAKYPGLIPGTGG